VPINSSPNAPEEPSYVEVLKKYETRATKMYGTQKKWGVWWRGVSFWLGLPAALLAAAAGVTGLIDSDDLSVLLAFAAAAISGILALTTPDQRAKKADALAADCDEFSTRVQMKRKRIASMPDDEAETLCTAFSVEWRQIIGQDGNDRD
jgi:hypothetical protein